jgi:hypothetical protein
MRIATSFNNRRTVGSGVFCAVCAEIIYAMRTSCPILLSERMLHKDYDCKGSVAKKKK